jgi:hypothetical protein
LCCALVWGCGSEDDTGGTADAGVAASADAAPLDAPAPMNIDDLCNADDGGFLEFFGRIAECYPELEIIIGQWPDDAFVSALCYGTYQPYFEDGSITMGSAADWQRCLDYVRNTPCDQLSTENPVACRDVMSGQVANGAACDIDEQCPKNSFCFHDESGGCGTCTPGLANMRACTTDAACASGNCVGNVDGREGTCDYFLAEGEPCFEDEECLGRMICDKESNACAKLGSYQEGSSCQSIETGCGFPTTDLYCDGDTMKCVRYKALGESCGLVKNLCKLTAYETCSVAAGNKCVAPTSVSENDPCNIFTGKECATGLICSNPFAGGTCVRPRGQGETCTEATPCHFMLTCVAGTCEYNDYTAMCPAPPGSP